MLQRYAAATYVGRMCPATIGDKIRRKTRHSGTYLLHKRQVLGGVAYIDINDTPNQFYINYQLLLLSASISPLMLCTRKKMHTNFTGIYIITTTSKEIGGFSQQAWSHRLMINLNRDLQPRLPTMGRTGKPQL